MEYRENQLTVEEYVYLRSSVGWDNFAREQIESCVRNSLYSVTVLEGDQTIAMGRLVGDGLYYMIVDIVVEPGHQKRGIGSRIMDLMLAYVEEHTPSGGRSSVQLIAEKGKEGFYLGKGFKLIPHEFCGSGMRKIIRK